MLPAEFCPFAVSSPQFHFVGCPVFAEGESKTWTLADLKERLLEVGTLYLQCNHEMHVGPWFDQRQAFGAREANLSQFIQKFHAIDDSDRFRTAVRVKYRADLTANLVDDIITELALASNRALSIAGAEKLTLGVAAAQLQPPVAPVSPKVAFSDLPIGQSSDDALSLASLTGRATAAYARTKGRFHLVACPGPKRDSELTAEEPSALNGDFVTEDHPNSWRIVDGKIYLPFSSINHLGFASIKGVGEFHLILGSPRGSDFEEAEEFAAFAKAAGALLRANPPSELIGGSGLSPDTFWAALLMFWSPAATQAVVRLGDCQVIRQPWAASLIALRAMRGVQAVAGQPAEGKKAEGTATDGEKPRVLLQGWHEIAAALDMKYADREKIKSLNDRIRGPITNHGVGTPPMVYRDELIDWWNTLAVRQAESENRRKGARASGEAQHNYGRDGIAAPEIAGGVKKRRRRGPA